VPGDLRLYQYASEIDAVLARAEDGELTPELERELDALLEGVPQKAASVLRVIRHQEMLEEGCQAEITRLRGIKTVLGRRVTSLRSYLCRCMAALGTKKIETEIGTISRVENSRPRITWAWTDREPPADYTRTVIKTEVDPEKVYRAWACGTLPEGFEVERSESLRIR
jgi:hypothetical protein